MLTQIPCPLAHLYGEAETHSGLDTLSGGVALQTLLRLTQEFVWHLIRVCMLIFILIYFYS